MADEVSRVELGFDSGLIVITKLESGEWARIGAPVATAFAHTFMWAAVMALLAVAPAVALLLAERARRRAQMPSATSTDDVAPKLAA